MKIKTIGEILRTSREQHGLSIAELTKLTRIRPEYLEALEENHFERLPAAVFVKGYIKNYSMLFGFDPKPVLALLRRDFKESAVGTLVPREFMKPVLKKREFWTPITFAVLALSSIFLTLLAYIAIQWYNIQKPPKLLVSEPADDAFVSSHIIVKGRTVSDAVVSVNTQPVSLQTDGTFQTEVFIPREGIHIITIESQDSRGKTSVIQRSVHVHF